jgi:C_GCAxxG_C_C family probable redox protein
LSAQALGEKAVAYHRDGYNCAQAVLLTLYDYMYPGSKNEVIPKIATGFGGGIGRCGNLCGALSGGVMAVGLKYGVNEINAEKKLQTYAQAQALFKLFEEQHGSVMCRSLIKYDLSDAEQMAKAKQTGAFEKVCTPLIKSVIEGFLSLK